MINPNALSLFYTDTAAVSRITLVDNVEDFAPVLTGIKCHLSLDAKPQLQQGPQVAKASAEYTVYCLPDVDIREGDRLTVTHAGETAQYDVGTVHIYSFNRTCRCRRRGLA